jgi:NADH dehydrogenase FAD-containing subunit
VVIVGGGFAGLFAARALRHAQVRVTLIDSRQHHLFQPLLYRCATGILSEGKIAAPLRDVLRGHRNVDCELAEVTGINAEQRRVIARRPLGEQIEFGYGYLILAAGVQQSLAHLRPSRRRACRSRTGGGRSASWPPRHCAANTRHIKPIMVVGDMMSLNKLPGVAEVAMQSGLYAGNRIRREVAGRPAGKPFRYHDLGLAAYISRGRAVVAVGPLHFGGLPGWVVWLFIHIAFLTGYRNRLDAVLTWWLAFTRTWPGTDLHHQGCGHGGRCVRAVDAVRRGRPARSARAARPDPDHLRRRHRLSAASRR